MASDFSVPLQGEATTTGTLYEARREHGRTGLLVLAHGAGAGHRHPFMTSMAARLADAGVDVVTFNFPYMEQKRRVPDRAPVLEDCYRAVIGAAIARAGGAGSLFIGGKSMGGRMATHLAAHGVEGLTGVVALGYPLHPPGRPEQRRVAHLPDITAQMLIIQGERDTFGTPAELVPVIETMPATVRLHVIQGGDHSLFVRGHPRDATYDSVCAVMLEWMRNAAPAAADEGLPS